MSPDPDGTARSAGPDGAARSAGPDGTARAEGPDGVLLFHGFTGSPQSVEGLGGAFEAAGFLVEMPLLPGHGSSVDDLFGTSWTDWSRAAEDAYQRLAPRSRRVIVGGLSMGGTLATWLASLHREIAALVVINPFIDPPAESFRQLLQGILESGSTVIPGIGSDLADPEVMETAYTETPIEPLLSLVDGLHELFPRLERIRCPVLVMTSAEDHVVPPVSSDVLAAQVSGPVERVRLENSFHIATLDHDRDEVERRAVEFARRTLSEERVRS